MFKITTLEFQSSSDFQRQLRIWVEMLPSVLGKDCQLLISPKTGATTLSLKSDDLKEFNSLYLHSWVKKQSAQAIELESNDFSPLWSHLVWEEFSDSQEAYFCFLEGGQVKACINEAFRLGIFNIQYQFFENKKILLKFMFPSHYFLLWVQEFFDTEVFWMDSGLTFLPFRKSHPLQKFWSNDNHVRVVSPGQILNLGQTNLQFKEIIDVVTWDYNLQEEQLSPSEEKLEITIKVGLKVDHSLRQSGSALWFYDLKDRHKLEDWIVNISSEQREDFVLLCAEKPVAGYFVGLREGVRSELVNPPVATNRFYRVFDGESLFVPLGMRLDPDLPLSEIHRIFDLPMGQSLILWPLDSTTRLLYLNDHRFDDLQSLVNYVVSDYREEIQALRSSMIFKDPSITLYEWEATLDADRSLDSSDKEDVMEQNFVEDFESQDIESVTDYFSNVPEAIEVESKNYNNAEILDQIRELHQELILEPILDKAHKWLQLGQLEFRLKNLKGAISCLELGIFMLGPEEKVSTKYKDSLLQSYLKIEGLVYEEFYSAILTRSSDEDFTSNELVILGLYLTVNRHQLSAEERDFFSRRYVVALESGLQRIPIASLCVIVFQGLLERDSNQYLIMKIKDYVLYSLFEHGLYQSASLPSFLLEAKSLNQDMAYLEELHIRLESYFKSASDVNRSRQEAMFRMIFAVGQGYQKNSSKLKSDLSQAEALTKTIDDDVLKCLYRCYEEAANRVINDDQIELGSIELKLENLTQAQRYKANRLIDKSLIFNSEQNQEFHDFVNHDIVGFRDKSESDLLELIPSKLKALEVQNDIPTERLAYKRKQHFSAILDSLPKLGETFTFQIVEEIYLQFSFLNNVEHRGSILGKMLALAYLFERDDWMGTLYQDFLALIDEIESYRLKPLIELLQPVVEYFPKMLSEVECLRLVEKVSSILKEDWISQKVRILLVRVLDAKGHQQLAQEYLMRALTTYFQKNIEDQQERLDLFQYLISHGCLFTLDLKNWLSIQLINSFDRIHDHLSVNEHFSLSKAQAMEFMIFMNLESEELSPELNKFMVEFEYFWKKHFVNCLRSINTE